MKGPDIGPATPDPALGLLPEKPAEAWTLERLSDAAGLVDVALQVGYESEAAFSRAFKRVVGVAPGAWRHGERNGPQPAA